MLSLLPAAAVCYTGPHSRAVQAARFSEALQGAVEPLHVQAARFQQALGLPQVCRPLFHPHKLKPARHSAHLRPPFSGLAA